MNTLWFLSLIFAVAVKAVPPIFEEKYVNVTFPSYVKSEIFCNASGDTPIKYTWYNEYSHKIDPNVSLPIYSLSTDTGSYLVFVNTDTSQNGSYTCSAQNAHGKASKIFEVFIDPDDENPLVKNVSISDVTESSVIFYVYTTRISDEIAVTFKEEWGQSWTSRYFTTNGNTELRIDVNNLIPGGKYNFQFNAVTAEGKHSAQMMVRNVVLLPSAPEVIFQSLKEGSLRIQWFTKSDDNRRGTILDHMLSYRTVSLKNGNYWDYGNCPRNITIPSCAAPFYTFSDLYEKSYYEFQVKARTIAGYGQSSKFKVYIQ